MITGNNVLYVDHKIINSVKIIIVDIDEAKKEYILNEGDLVELSYIEGKKLMTCNGKLTKINTSSSIQSLLIDCSQINSSDIRIVEIPSIRSIVHGITM